MNNFYEGKRVVVTGGAGFIGSHLVDLLLQAGSDVTVPIKNDNDNPKYLNQSINKIKLIKNSDLMNLETCKKVTNGAEIVMNLAAKVGGIEYNIKHPGSIFRENMQVFSNVLEASRLNNIERFLTVSSACVYPRYCTIPTPEEEGLLGSPEPTNEGYGWAKRMEEFMSVAYHKQYGMKIGIARPYNAYGPRDNFDPESSHVIPALIRRAITGENPFIVWGNGEQSRSFLYARDFAEGLMQVCEKYSQGDPVNIGSSEETKIKDIVKLILEISGKSPEVIFDETKPTGQPRRCCDTKKCEKKIGFKAKTSLKEGLEETIEWYKDQKHQ
tara:strand:+ start:13861 stop:14841 length:981 start_codon:yes stop_codon:yes gene_type:complete